MPYIRSDEEAEYDDEGNVKNDAEFEYYAPEDFAYEPKGFNPATVGALATKLLDLLRGIGGTHFRVCYDGGHDEGFAHADSVRTVDGTNLPIEDLVVKLATPQTATELRDAASAPSASRWYQAGEYYRKLSDIDVVKSGFDELADHVVAAKLGEGYGTGEYSMYGEMVIDLRDGTITDNPDATKPTDVTFD